MGSVMDQERPWERDERPERRAVPSNLEARVTSIEDVLIKISEHPFFTVSPLAVWADHRKQQRGSK